MLGTLKAPGGADRPEATRACQRMALPALHRRDTAGIVLSWTGVLGTTLCFRGVASSTLRRVPIR
jgi:hypothetical protein